MSQNDGQIIFYAPSTRTRTFAVVDQHNIRRFYVVVGECIEVNRYYTISSSQMVRFNRFSEQKMDGNVDCEIKVNVEHSMFYARIGWNNSYHYFDIYPNGVVLKDPIVVRKMFAEMQSIANASQPEDEKIQ